MFSTKLFYIHFAFSRIDLIAVVLIPLVPLQQKKASVTHWAVQQCEQLILDTARFDSPLNDMAKYNNTKRKFRINKNTVL